MVYPVNIASYGVNSDQIKAMAEDPKAAVQFAQFLKAHVRKNRKMKNVMVKSSILVSFNGRKPQYMFDPDLDLTTLNTSLEIKNNVLQLKELK